MTINSQIVVNIRSQFNDKGMKRFEKNLNLVKKEQEFVNKAFTKFGKDGQTTMKQVQAAAKRTREEMKRFRSEFLSLMFFGMALERAFGGILRASFQTFKQMTEDSSRANNSMTRLTAAWEFFKFTLFEALLRSGVFDKFIQWLIDGIHWFGELSERGQTLVAEILAIGAAIGTALTGVGIIAMGVGGVSNVMPTIRGIAGNVTRALAGVGIIYLGFNRISDIMDSLDEGQFGEALHKTITGAMMGTGLFRMMRSQRGGGVIFAIGLALDMVDDSTFQSQLSRMLAWLGHSFLSFLTGLAVMSEKYFIGPLLSAAGEAVERIGRAIASVPGMGRTGRMIIEAGQGLSGWGDSMVSGQGRAMKFHQRVLDMSVEELADALERAGQYVADGLTFKFLNQGPQQQPGLFTPEPVPQVPGQFSPDPQATSINIQTVNVMSPSNNDANALMSRVITQAQRDGSAPYMN